MSFFGAIFAGLTMYWEWNTSGLALAAPFIVFAAIGLAAAYIIRLPGNGFTPSEKTERAIMWSSIAEGVGLFLAGNIVMNLHRPELLLPAMALVVGLHFLPIARAAILLAFLRSGCGSHCFCRRRLHPERAYGRHGRGFGGRDRPLGRGDIGRAPGLAGETPLRADRLNWWWKTHPLLSRARLCATICAASGSRLAIR